MAVLSWLALTSGCAGDASMSESPDADGGAAGAATTAESPSAEALIPARVRRLSNNEYDVTVARLLGTELAPGHGFAPDARQAGFTVNEAQRVDAVLARQLYAAAEHLAAEARGRFAQLAPCATPADPEACARAFIASFGARAYRRPLIEVEASGLLEVFRAGALDATYEDGVELVIRAVLQSAGFLYLTELGAVAEAGAAPPPGSAIPLTQYELASALSYAMTGGPPDQALLDAAASGSLASAQARRGEAQRLRRDHPESRDQLVRTLREWLELDRIEFTAKDIAYYPTYEFVWAATSWPRAMSSSRRYSTTTPRA